jgi:hypothetical protein
MTDYRAITAIDGAGKCPDPGAAPNVFFPMLSELVVNEEYQRRLSTASFAAIRRMARNWNWSSFKAPNVAATDTPNVWEVIDGQHTAIAAATNGFIQVMPCLLVPAATTREKAASFLGINQAKIGLTAAAIYNAELAAGDELATGVQIALNASGCRILPFPPPDGKYAIGDTMAIGSLKQVVRIKGSMRLKRILEVGVDAGSAPVSALLVKALDVALPPDPSPEITSAVGKMLRGQGAVRLEMIAKSRTIAGGRSYMTFADMISSMARLPATRMGLAKAGSVLPKGRT